MKFDTAARPKRTTRCCMVLPFDRPMAKRGLVIENASIRFGKTGHFGYKVVCYWTFISAIYVTFLNRRSMLFKQNC